MCFWTLLNRKIKATLRGKIRTPSVRGESITPVLGVLIRAHDLCPGLPALAFCQDPEAGKSQV